MPQCDHGRIQGTLSICQQLHVQRIGKGTPECLFLQNSVDVDVT